MFSIHPRYRHHLLQMTQHKTLQMNSRLYSRHLQAVSGGRAYQALVSQSCFGLSLRFGFESLRKAISTLASTLAEL